MIREAIKNVPRLLTQDNITTFIAVAGFLLSSGQLLFGLWHKRYNLKISNTGYSIIKSEFNSSYREYIFGFFVENLSSNPVNIMYISALCKGGAYVRCTLTHRILKEHFIPPGLERPYQFFTSDFPIHLDGHCSKLIFIMFICSENEEILFTNSGDVTFQIKSDLKDDVFSLSCIEETTFLDQ